MKKISILLAGLMVLASVSSVFAKHDGNIASGELSLTTSGDPATLVIGLSPKVSARYINPGTDDAGSQWFSIATAHPGGNTIYGTAQNLNNIYQKTFQAGTPLTTSNMNIPTSINSASDWSANGWDM